MLDETMNTSAALIILHLSFQSLTSFCRISKMRLGACGEMKKKIDRLLLRENARLCDTVGKLLDAHCRYPYQI